MVLSNWGHTMYRPTFKRGHALNSICDPSHQNQPVFSQNINWDLKMCLYYICKNDTLFLKIGRQILFLCKKKVLFLMFFFTICCLLLVLYPTEATLQLVGFDVMSHIFTLFSSYCTPLGTVDVNSWKFDFGWRTYDWDRLKALIRPSPLHRIRTKRVHFSRLWRTVLLFT